MGGLRTGAGRYVSEFKSIKKIPKPDINVCSYLHYTVLKVMISKNKMKCNNKLGLQANFHKHHFNLCPNKNFLQLW